MNIKIDICENTFWLAIWIAILISVIIVVRILTLSYNDRMKAALDHGLQEGIVGTSGQVGWTK